MKPDHRVVGEDELLGHVARASVEVAHVRTVVDRVVVDGQRIKSGGRHIEDGERRRGGSTVARERTVLDGERLVRRSGDIENSAIARARGFKVKPSRMMYFAPLNRAVKLEAIADEVGAKVKTGELHCWGHFGM